MRQKVVSLGAPEGKASVLPMGASFKAHRVEGRAAGGVSPRRLPPRLRWKARREEGARRPDEAIRSTDVPGVELTVVGDGPLRAELEAKAAGLAVTFLGQLGRSALRSVLRGSDLAVVPSVLAASGDKDGLPVAMLEAMGNGLPVVASDLPGINEALEDGVSGPWWPPGDVKRLREAIGSLAGDPERRQVMGEQATERAKEFTVAAGGARYRRLLGDMLGSE